MMHDFVSPELARYLRRESLRSARSARPGLRGGCEGLGQDWHGLLKSMYDQMTGRAPLADAVAGRRKTA